MTLEQVPETGMKLSLFFVFFFLSCVCNAELLILDVLCCFCGSFIFTTASFYHIYSEKNLFSLTAVFVFSSKRSALPTHNSYGLGDLPCLVTFCFLACFMS